MPEKVSRCPYCQETDPHQGPTGCPPIQWPPLGSEAVDHVNRFGEQDGQCIHPGVFSRMGPDGKFADSEFCITCHSNVPASQL
jgi:hypothetical protein